jgi:hypothetical protein
MSILILLLVVLGAFACDFFLFRWSRNIWIERGTIMGAEPFDRLAAIMASSLDTVLSQLSAMSRWVQLKVLVPGVNSMQETSASADTTIQPEPARSSTTQNISTPPPSESGVTSTPAQAITPESASTPPLLEQSLVPNLSHSPITAAASPAITAATSGTQFSINLPVGTAIRFTIEARAGEGLAVHQETALPAQTSQLVRPPAPSLSPAASLIAVGPLVTPRQHYQTSQPRAIWLGKIEHTGQRIVGWLQQRAILLGLILFTAVVVLYVVTQFVGSNRLPSSNEALAGAAAVLNQSAQDDVLLEGQTVTVFYSQLGAGSITDILDGHKDTLIRGLDDNPLFMEFHYPEPRIVKGIGLTIGSLADFTVVVKLSGADGASPIIYTKTFQGLPDDPHVDLDFDQGPESASVVRIEITNNLSGEEAAIHVRDLEFK